MFQIRPHFFAAFGLAAASLSAHADPEKEARCRKSIEAYVEWRDSSAADRCARTLAGRAPGETVYFLIEGASGYSPNRMAADLTGMRAACGGLPDSFAAPAPTPPAEGDEDESAVSADAGPLAEARSAFDGPRENIAPPLILKNVAEKHLGPRKQRWVYFAQGEWKAAEDCARKLVADLPPGARAPVRVMGWSMGGYVALRIAKALEDAGHPAIAGLSVDPVGRSFRAWPSLVSNRNSKYLPRLASTPWWNFYQKSDVRSLTIGIKGSAVPNAAIDREVTREELDATAADEKHAARSGHKTIFDTTVLREALARFVTAEF